MNQQNGMMMNTALLRQAQLAQQQQQQQLSSNLAIQRARMGVGVGAPASGISPRHQHQHQPLPNNSPRMEKAGLSVQVSFGWDGALFGLLAFVVAFRHLYRVSVSIYIFKLAHHLCVYYISRHVLYFIFFWLM